MNVSPEDTLLLSHMEAHVIHFSHAQLSTVNQADIEMGHSCADSDQT